MRQSKRIKTRKAALTSQTKMDFCPWLLSRVRIFSIALLLCYSNVFFYYFSSFYYFLICHIKIYENLAKKGQHLLHNHCNLLFRSGRFLKHKSKFYIGCLPGLPDDLRIMYRKKVKSNITIVQQCSQGASAEPAMWQGRRRLDRRREGEKPLHYQISVMKIIRDPYAEGIYSSIKSVCPASCHHRTSSTDWAMPGSHQRLLVHPDALSSTYLILIADSKNMAEHKSGHRVAA